MHRLGQRITIGAAAFAIAATQMLGMLPATALAEGDVEAVEAVAAREESTEEGTLEAQAVSGWYRIAGAGAYDTMQEILNFGGVFQEVGGTVVVASGDGYWDALAATGLAGVQDAPVIITPGNSLATQSKDELVRLAPRRVLVIGGPKAVSDDVVKAIRTALPSANVRRVYGESAHDTALKIYDEGGFSKGVAVVATSDGYWDALSIAPFAYAKQAPIFLTKSGSKPEERILSDDAVKAIKNGGFEQVVIVGGDQVVAKAVEEQLKDQKVKRIAGADALATSGEIARWEVKDQGMTTEHLTVATTEGYWDALSGAALAGKQNSVLVLAHVKDGYAAIDAVYDSAAADNVAGQVLGGTKAISDDTLLYLIGKKPAASTNASSSSNSSSTSNASSTSSTSAQG